MSFPTSPVEGQRHKEYVFADDAWQFEPRFIDGDPVGKVSPFPMNTPPAGWEECDGGELNRTQYAQLFAAIGTTHGAGDGSTTFNKPDYRGLTLRGTGSHGSATKADGTAYAGPDVGATQNDQGQQITGSARFAGVFEGNIIYSYSGALSSTNASNDDGQESHSQTPQSETFSFDSANSTAAGGSRQDGDEFRGANAGVLWCIKVATLTLPDTPATSLKYDGGWVANSDWTNAELVANHGLGAPLSELIVKFFISTDGTDANSFEIGDFARLDVDATSSNSTDGWSILQVSNDEIKIQTGADGILYITDTGNTNRLNTDPYYYRIVIYKPQYVFSAIRNVPLKSVSSAYTVEEGVTTVEADSNSSGFTVTLPDSSGLPLGHEITVRKVSTDTNTITVAAQGSDTITGGGAELTHEGTAVTLTLATGGRWFPDSEGVTTTSATDTTAGRVATTDSAVMNGDYPSDSAWTTVTSLDNGWTGEVQYIKRLGWVTVTVGGGTELDGSSATAPTVLSLPSNYRPSEPQRGVVNDRSPTPNESTWITVLSGGNINISDVDGSQIAGQVTYPVF